MARATFVEVLCEPPSGGAPIPPCVEFGRLHRDAGLAAVGHSETDQQGRLRVPRDLVLRLQPRADARDAWLEPRSAWHVRLDAAADDQPLGELLEGLRRAEPPGLRLRAVVRVDNPAGEVVLPLLPHQVRARRPADPPYERRFTHHHGGLALHPELAYLARHPEARLAHYPRVTSSCRQKLDLLEEGGQAWSIERIISAHYFTRPGDPRRYTVLVGPELRELCGGDPSARERLVSALAGYQVRYARRAELPAEMESGTCTPFVFARRAPDLEQVILLRGRPELRHLAEEFSIGGHGPEAHAAGLQVRPALTEAILREELRLPLTVRDRY